LFTCGPDFNKAELSYTYGDVINFGQTTYAVNTKKDLTDCYVKVVLSQTAGDDITWYGIIIETEKNQNGNGFNNVADPTKSTNESGKQSFLAIGLEYLLEREIYDSSWARLVATEWEFERGIGFNMGSGNSRRLEGNMDLAGDKGSPVFSKSIADGGEWSGANIIDYLLTYHAPKDLAGTDHLTWSLDIDAKANETLASILPVLDCHGWSIKRIIDAVCDRRRAISWKVAVDPLLESVGIEVFTFNKTAIPLDGGGTIDANTDTVEIDLAYDPRVISCPLVTSSTSKFDKVVARGDPVILTLSLTPFPITGQGTVIKDWTDANETAYNDAATGAAGYSSLDNLGKQGWNAAYRNAPALQRTYRYFLWDPDQVFQEVPAAVLVGNTLTPIQVWAPGGRFLGHLSLKYDTDYTTISTSPTSTAPPASVDEHMRPFAVIEDGSRFFKLDYLDWETHTDAMLRKWSGSLRMRHDQLGFVIDISGAPQHVIANAEFIPADDTDVTPYDSFSPSDTGRLYWQDIVVTVALELDNAAEAQWPEPALVAAPGDAVKTLIIEVPGRKMEYVAANTVFGLDAAGALKKNTVGGWLTDDTTKLRWVAIIAYLWYETPRKAFEYHFRSLDCTYHIGQLVTNLITTNANDDANKTKEEVNTVITSIALDLRQGTYRLRTSFADFDARVSVL